MKSCICAHINMHYRGCVSHTVAMLKHLNLWDPQGISSSNTLVSIADHSMHVPGLPAFQV